MTRRRMRIAVLLVAAGFALLTAELALRLVVFPRGVFPPGDPGPPELRYTEFDPDLGWRLRPGARGRERSAEFDLPIEISPQGLRGERVYAPGPIADRTRIVAAGDSFTFGVGVGLSEAWPARLEQELPGSEVVNLGVPGYGTDQQLIDLERRIAELRPRVVVLGLYIGDVPRNVAAHLNGYAKPWFEPDASGILVKRGVPVPEVSDAESLARLRGGALERLRLGEILLRVLPQVWLQIGRGEAWPRTQALIERMAEVCGAHDARLFVLLIPRLDAVEGQGLRRSLHRRAYRRLLEIAGRSGVPVIDPLPALDAWVLANPGQAAYWPRDHHFTADGQRVVATAVARQLAAAAVLPADQTRR